MGETAENLDPLHPVGGVPPAEPEGPPAGIGPARPRGGRTRGIIVAVLLGGTLIGVLGAAMKVKPSSLSQTPGGRAAPDFTLPLLREEGSSITLSDLRGKRVLLNFWASWCVPCKQEAPVLAAAWKRWESKGVVFLGVDAQDSKKWAMAFEDKYGIEYQSVVDGTQEIMAKYGVLGFPETFFIGRDGTIVDKYIGPLDEATLEAYLSDLVQR